MQSYYRDVESASVALFDGDYANCSLEQLIDKFIRMRELAVFTRSLKQKYVKDKRCPSLKDRLGNFITSADLSFRSFNTELCSSDEEHDQCTDHLSAMSRLEQSSIRDARITARPALVTMHRAAQWKKIWSCICKHLESLPATHLPQRLEHQTRLVAAHVTNRVSLDPLCYTLMLECLEPSLIVQLFSRELIRSSDLFHIDCLFERSDAMFHILTKPEISQEGIRMPTYIVLSVCCFLYKVRCVKKRSSIIKRMNTKLRQFVLKGKFHSSFKVACKLLLNALVTCGILNRAGVMQFLNGPYRNAESYPSGDENEDTDDDIDMEHDLAERVRRQPELQLDQDEDLSDMSDDSELDMDALDDDDDDDDDELIPQRRNFDEIMIHNNNHNEAIEQQQPVGKHLDIDVDQFKEMLPTSLKNQCRHVIKYQLAEYTRRSVHKLTMLPDDLKEYLLHEPECGAIVAYADKVKRMQHSTHS